MWISFCEVLIARGDSTFNCRLGGCCSCTSDSLWVESGIVHQMCFSQTLSNPNLLLVWLEITIVDC